MGDARSSPPGELRPSSNDLAARRTVLAADRTLMAWIRTALAMISFGFTIYKFLHGLSEAAALHLHRPNAPRNLGLVLTGLGTASLVAGVVEYIQVIRAAGEPRGWLRTSFFVACGVIILGFAVLAGILIRTGPF